MKTPCVSDSVLSARGTSPFGRGRALRPGIGHREKGCRASGELPWKSPLIHVVPSPAAETATSPASGRRREGVTTLAFCSHHIGSAFPHFHQPQPPKSCKLFRPPLLRRHALARLGTVDQPQDARSVARGRLAVLPAPGQESALPLGAFGHHRGPRHGHRSRLEPRGVLPERPVDGHGGGRKPDRDLPDRRTVREPGASWVVALHAPSSPARPMCF
jgi:hypothetical protein